MRRRIADENRDAAKLLPPTSPDGSGVGVNYADAFIRPLNVELEDGTTITCKRKGLRITLGIGDRTADAIMNRFEHGPDPRDILLHALKAAARTADSQFTFQEGGLYLDI